MKGPVVFDKERNTIAFNLPDNCQEYITELGSYLQQEFAYESINGRTINEMNRVAIEWLTSKGVHVNWDNNKETVNGNKE